MTPSELANQFYDNRYEKEEDVIEDWCPICMKYTKHTPIRGNNGLDSYSYCICQTCGHEE